MFSEEVTKKQWPHGIWCVVCGLRIAYGQKVYWIGMEGRCRNCVS